MLLVGVENSPKPTRWNWVQSLILVYNGLVCPEETRSSSGVGNLSATCVPTPFFLVGCFPNNCPKVLLVSLLLIFIKRLYTHFGNLEIEKIKRRKWKFSITLLATDSILVGVTRMFCG